MALDDLSSGASPRSMADNDLANSSCFDLSTSGNGNEVKPSTLMLYCPAKVLQRSRTDALPI